MVDVNVDGKPCVVISGKYGGEVGTFIRYVEKKYKTHAILSCFVKLRSTGRPHLLAAKLVRPRREEMIQMLPKVKKGNCVVPYDYKLKGMDYSRTGIVLCVNKMTLSVQWLADGRVEESHGVFTLIHPYRVLAIEPDGTEVEILYDYKPRTDP